MRLGYSVSAASLPVKPMPMMPYSRSDVLARPICSSVTDAPPISSVSLK